MIENLGPQTGSYGAQRWPAWRMALLFLFIASGLAVTALGLVEPTALVLGLPWVAFFAWNAWQSPNINRRLAQSRVETFTEGLVVNGEPFRFDSIAVLQHLEKQLHLYVIVDHTGRTTKVTHLCERIDELGTRIRQGLLDAQLGPVLQAARAGHEIPFGPYVLHRDGLNSRKGQLLWQDIKNVKLDGTTLVIDKNGKLLPETTEIKTIPNHAVLLTAMSEL